MLTFIILGALSVIIGVWALNKGSKTTTPIVTKEEEPVGYESGSFDSIAAPKPKKKTTSKNTAKNESLAKMEVKPKKAKKA